MESNDHEFILVMGPTGSGKTSFINAASSSFFAVGHGLRSCTAHVNFSEPFNLDGRKVVLFDTPGFDDTSKNDVEILTELGVFLTRFYEQQKKLIGIIYLHDINNARMGNIAVRNVLMLSSIVGEAASRNVAILTTKWDIVEPDTGERRYRELIKDPQFFGDIIKSGATIWKYSTNENPLVVIRHIITNHKRTNLPFVAELQAGKTIGETSPGRIVNEAIYKAKKKAAEEHAKKMDQIRQSIKVENEKEIERVNNMLNGFYEGRIIQLEKDQAALKKSIEEAREANMESSSSCRIC